MTHKPALLTLSLVAVLCAATALSAQTSSQPDQRAELVQAFLAKTDTNGDGTLTPDEIAARRAQAFARIDRDGDGQIDPAEAETARQTVKRLAALAENAIALNMTRRDGDADGMISLAEFTAPSRGFALVDRDDDGGLSAVEITRFLTILNP